MKSLFAFSAALLLTVAAAYAQTAPATPVESPMPQVPVITDHQAKFRSGVIYSAELSGIKPVFSDEDPNDPVPNNNSGWIEVVVKLDAGRTLSRYDYVLKRRSEYPCYAIAEGDAPYSRKEWCIKNTQPDKFYRLLFVIPSMQTVNMFALIFKFDLFQTQIANPDIRIRNLFQNPFSSLRMIPADGCLGVPYDPNALPPPPALPAAAPVAAPAAVPAAQPAPAAPEIKK